MDGDDQLKRVPVVVCDVGPREAGFAWFGTRILMVLVGTAIGRIADVGVVEMQPGHFFVVICRSVHVRGPGDEAERQVQGAAPQCEKPLHPTEYTRRLLAETGSRGVPAGSVRILKCLAVNGLARTRVYFRKHCKFQIFGRSWVHDHEAQR